jgi:hypothetical protein
MGYTDYINVLTAAYETARNIFFCNGVGIAKSYLRNDTPISSN